MRKIEIPALHQGAMSACRDRIDNLTKPIYSLAQLEKIAERLAGITENEQPNHLRHSVVIVGGDAAVDGPQNHTHGVESFAAMKRLSEGHSATHGVANRLGASVFLVDAGLELDTTSLENVLQKKVTNTPHFFRLQEVLTAEEAEQAFEAGFQLAAELKEQGYQTIGIGNVGERSGLCALAVTAAVTECTMEELLADNQCSLSIKEKAERLQATLSGYDVSKEDPFTLMRTFAGPDIVMLTGLVLGAAAHRMAVVFDNTVTGAAILLAHAINPAVMDYVFPSVKALDPVQDCQMKYLGIKPYLFYHIEMDEALGSTMGLSVLNGSLHMLNDMKTFGEAEVTVAEDGPGSGRQDGR